jgi:hypothetical protein
VFVPNRYAGLRQLWTDGEFACETADHQVVVNWAASSDGGFGAHPYAAHRLLKSPIQRYCWVRCTTLTSCSVHVVLNIVASAHLVPDPIRDNFLERPRFRFFCGAFGIADGACIDTRRHAAVVPIKAARSTFAPP